MRFQSKMIKHLALFVALAAIGIGIGIHYYFQRIPELPELDFERWWGDGAKQKEDKSIRPFEIVFNDTITTCIDNRINKKDNVTLLEEKSRLLEINNHLPELEMIEDLKSRLRNRRAFTRPLDGTQSQYGMNTIYLEKILKYWLGEYNFKERAKRLNQFPHFKTKIQGLDIHYIRVKPDARGKKVLPLLLIHGWPSSSKEFDMVIPMLTTPRSNYDFVFEIIAVDLPGFGFSEGTNKPGLNPLQLGIIMRNLMKRLGFNKYYIQAGDWGSQVGTHISTVFQDEVLGFHTNTPISTKRISHFKYILGSMFPSFIVDDKHRHRMYPLTDLFKYLMRESGYFHLQSTKPDTIGAALTDTPAGLAAYVLEKIGICSNRDQLHTPHGGMEEINIDDLLDTVTIMWANERITTSARIYAEAFSWPEVFIVHEIPTKVPTAAINFQYEVLYQPDWILRDKFLNLVRSTTLEFGGHFAAMQTPKALVDDVFESVVEFIKFHKQNHSK